ncbi:MAG: TonB-dependent receptor [Bacteroidales bacterium]|nr:TonB-dependent receptor [Bacteroidales bacterium]MBR5781715.1 TonB-dependent receptor [Bacteroidales bacterium]
MQTKFSLTTLIITIVLLFSNIELFAQNDNNVKGFVYEKASGEPVMFCNVYFKGTTLGASTDINGFFNITRIPDGDYTILITNLGFDTIAENISLRNNQVVNKKYYLEESSVVLQAVSVTADKIEAQTETKTSVVNITPKTITKIPSMGGQADLAQYLQVLPGVVFTGDQGGQLYIRGGSPIQNKVLLDGMVIYNPFHSIGLFSVFDTDIIRNAEIFTGGFGAEYGGRISSVMDITTRDGNKKRISGKIGASTFGAKLTLEGPLKKAKDPEDMTASFIFSAKNSYLEKTSQTIYKGVLNGETLPYNYRDLYGKVSLNSSNGSKINFFGFNFTDDVSNYKSISNFGWDSYGAGTNFVVIPGKSPVLIEGNIAFSDYSAVLEEKNNPNRESSINGFNAGFAFTYFLGKNSLKYGIEMLGFKTVFDYTKSNGIKISQVENTTELGGYIKYKAQFNDFIFEPSFRVQAYASISEVSPEPRLALKYNITDWFRVKAAGGIYSQNLIAANSDRDVVNLFYGFLSGQSNLPTYFNGEKVTTKLQKAVHYILGTEFDVYNNITINVEGYYKDFNQLTSMNRNQIYSETTAPPGTPQIEKKDFMIETGDAYGIDFSVKYEDKRWYLWAAYSWAHVNKDYENTEGELVTYRTHYDRRHNVNLIATYTAGAKSQWELSARWNFGTGFPFTMVSGFYEELPYDNIYFDPYTESGQLGFLYSDLNTGQLPTYHRLDFDAKRKFYFSESVILEANFSITNVYDRNNIFYIDIVTAQKIYQLPLMPSLGLTLSF